MKILGSNSKNIVPPQREKYLIKQEPSRVFQRLGVTIGSLPDNVLLDIFDFYQVLINKSLINERPWDWERLVHVCRRWRYITFESPVRLNLQLFCTEKSPVRKLLDVWPPLPLVIRFNDHSVKKPEDRIDSMDNLIAALERRDRIHEIQVLLVSTPNHLCNKILTEMEEPFPALRSLEIEWPFVSSEKILPDTLLNGSAPCLRRLTLWATSFPSLPQLLSSTRDLTCLNLFRKTNSGCIPPERMATCLSALLKLESLSITLSSTPHFERRNRAASVQTRFVLPALTFLKFQGESEYLEVLTARIDAPILVDFIIKFLHQPVFDIPQTILFFSHLDSFKPSSLTLIFKPDSAFISFPSNRPKFLSLHSWRIMCYDSDDQTISVAQICSQILHFRSSVKSLTIKCHTLIDDFDSTLLLQLFHSFPSVHSLRIPAHLEPLIASALGRPTGESPAAAEVFPLLQSLSIVGKKSDETVQRHIQSFIAERQTSGRPVTISYLRT